MPKSHYKPEDYLRRKARVHPIGEAPLCACGCGRPTKWLFQTKIPGRTKRGAGWGKYLSGHNARVFGEGRRGNVVQPDLSNPIWCYLLGAHLGDGCDSHRLDIAACEPEWSGALVETMTSVGLEPYVSKNFRVRASCPMVMSEFSRWKFGGHAGIWAFPNVLSCWMDVLAGLMDSDGGINTSGHSGGTWNVYNRANGNIERLDMWLREQGETRLHVGHSHRSGFSHLKDGRKIKLRDSDQLGLRGHLRDELASHLRSPIKIEVWRAYRTKHPAMTRAFYRAQPARDAT